MEVTTLVAAATMAGVPLTAGFIAKEADFESFADAGFGGHWLLLGVVVARLGADRRVLRAFYWSAFVAPRRRAPSSARRRRDDATGHRDAVVAIRRRRRSLLASGASRSAWCRRSRTRWRPLGSRALRGRHVGPPRDLARLEPRARALRRGARNRRPAVRALSTAAGRAAPAVALPIGERVYFGSLRGVASVSHRVTGIVQNGSLPVYAGVILTTALGLPALVLVTEWDWSGWPTPWGGSATSRSSASSWSPPSARPGPPPLRGGPVPRRDGLRDGRALRRLRRARPGAHAGRGRDALDGRVRAGAPTAAEAVRTAVVVAPPRRAGAIAGFVGRGRLRLR